MRHGLLQIWYFRSPSMPSPPTPGYHYGKVTRWRKVTTPAGGGTSEGDPATEATYEYSDTKPDDLTGWEEFSETKLLPDEDYGEEARKKEAEEKAKIEAELLRKRRGRRSTILTGGAGVGGEPNTQMPTLLGGRNENLG